MKGINLYPFPSQEDPIIDTQSSRRIKEIVRRLNELLLHLKVILDRESHPEWLFDNSAYRLWKEIPRLVEELEKSKLQESIISEFRDFSKRVEKARKS